MIDVDDEVADLQVAKVGEERLRRRASALGRAPFLLEDVRFRVDLQARIGQTESARQRADDDEHRGVARVLRALGGDGEDLVFLEQLDRSFRTARRGRDEQRRLAGVPEAADLGHPIGNAAPELGDRLTADRTGRQCGLRTADCGLIGDCGIRIAD